ncbi:MAG: transcription termination factor NusA [bacterium]|nr:transcription termination factor NusA [bacterium]
MAQNEISAAARALCEEKGISLDDVIETIESALAAAYRKDYGEKNQNIKAKFDIDTGEAKFYDEKTVVEDLPAELLEEMAEVEKSGEEKAGAYGVKTDDRQEKKKKLKKEEAKKIVEEDSEDKKKETKKGVEEGKPAQADGEAGEEEKRRFNPRTEIQLSDAQALKKKYKIDDVIVTDLKIPDGYGRMAAQTAKQVIIQRVREIERNNLYNEFKDKEHEVITGVVQRREGRIVLVDLGRVAGVIPPDGQVPGEQYQTGQRIKIYVESVNITAKGPEIILSRTSPEIVRKIFFVEIPEITNGLIDIKSVAREAGSRSKIAVVANEENVDPIGSCVGQRGARIQTIISELSGEKVDIIEYSEDLAVYVANALAPAKSVHVEIDEAKKTAVARVSADQLSLAIGKGGQNVRLAARLTGWRIDVKESVSPKPDDSEKNDESAKSSEDSGGEVQTDEKNLSSEDSQTEIKEVKSEEVKSKKAKKSTAKKAAKKEVKEAVESVEAGEEKAEDSEAKITEEK